MQTSAVEEQSLGVLVMTIAVKVISYQITTRTSLLDKPVFVVTISHPKNEMDRGRTLLNVIK
jgi:hypothetical protein